MILSKTNNPSNENLRSRGPLFWLCAVIVMTSVCTNSGCHEQSKASAALEEQDKVSETSPAIRPGIEFQPEIDEFDRNKISKNNIIPVLALDSVARERYFTSTYHSLDPQQVERVGVLVGSYDLQFSKLLNERSAILEHALDGDGSEVALSNVSVETLILSQLIRKRILGEILTRQQREEFNKEYEDEINATNEALERQEKDS